MSRRDRMEKLPRGAVKAVASAKWRVPEDAPETARDLADRALTRIAEVMEGAVPVERQSATLKAALAIREEICGPVVKRIEVEGKMGLGALLAEVGRLEEGAQVKVLDAPPPKALEGSVEGAEPPPSPEVVEAEFSPLNEPQSAPEPSALRPQARPPIIHRKAHPLE